MKTCILTIFMMVLFGAQGFAAEDKKAKKAVEKTTETQILSPELEKLFFSERLGETVIKPVYTSTEQFIYSEQIKQVKK